MNRNPDTVEAERIRGTIEYRQAIGLITEKKELQNRLREIDKQLRQLRMLGTGVTAVARKDLENETNDVKNLGGLSSEFNLPPLL